MTDHAARIEQFMVKAGQRTPLYPIMPGEETRRLRASLITEEYLETMAALGFAVAIETGQRPDGTMYYQTWLHPHGTPDLVKIVDGCADLSVVVIGTLISCGVNDQPILEMVDEANLRKFDPPLCPDCQHSVMKVQRSDNFANCQEWYCPSCYTSRPIHFGGHLREDGKWLKGTSWEAPDIAGELARQGWDGILQSDAKNTMSEFVAKNVVPAPKIRGLK